MYKFRSEDGDGVFFESIQSLLGSYQHDVSGIFFFFKQLKILQPVGVCYVFNRELNKVCLSIYKCVCVCMYFFFKDSI